MERVYLDICSLKRPFDDQRQPRVREEATAVAAIVARAEAGEIVLVRSPTHLVENDANPREDRRLAAALWIDGAAIDVTLDPDVEARAGELVALGFRPLDALHLAFAARAVARWFVTYDDELLKRAERLGDALRTLVVALQRSLREGNHESGGGALQLRDPRGRLEGPHRAARGVRGDQISHGVRPGPRRLRRGEARAVPRPHARRRHRTRQGEVRRPKAVLKRLGASRCSTCPPSR